MKRALPLWSLLLLLCAASAHAQLYKWVGPDGKVNYTDTPPPKSAKQVETKTIAGDGSPVVDLPYELAEAAKNHPVTLYSTANCAACDAGRTMLNARGIPFSEKTVSSNDDIERLKQAGGNNQLPFLTIGRYKQQGFEPGAWNNQLTIAGYPETNTLPKTYRNPKAESAAPVIVTSTQEKPAANEANAAKPGSTELPPATGNVPPGFRF